MPADRVDRIAAALEKDPPEGFRGRYSREVWAVIVTAVLAADAEESAQRARRVAASRRALSGDEPTHRG
jgi:hypothetical protein